MISIQDCRILSIQSHVVSGYVGNKCIAFPLQILGFDVDTVHTVQFSNHTGYPVWKGQVTDTDDLEAILIMGDHGFLYVPAELVPIYKKDLLPMADIVTPNQFESELLTGMTIHDEGGALDAMEALHVMGATSVVITSTTVENNANTLVVFASKRTGDRMTSLRVDVPRVDAQFCGTGDLFAAILVGWMTKSNNNLRVSIEKTVSTIQAVLKKTFRHAQNMHTETELKYTSHELELRLVQSKDEIEEPPQNFKSVALT
ncbi:hypothetical protein MRX96_037099 [Rhipicephalus microplus]